MTAGTLIDYLTCGGCGKEYPLKDITNFIHHKKIDCQDGPPFHESGQGVYNPGSEDSTLPSYGSWEITQIGPNETVLSCYSCSQDFVTARGLLNHVQLSHNLKIFFQRDSFAKTPTISTTKTDYPETLSEEKTDKNENTRTTVEINQEKGTVKTNLSKTCSELAAAGGTTICCNSKECCVTIIPGTHERPKKCCSAIVPKKRKRHMEEHMGVEEDRVGEREETGEEMEEDEEGKDHHDENGNEEDRDDTTSNDAIYIDFRPHGNQGDGKRDTSNNDEIDADSSWGTLEVRQGRSDSSVNSCNASENHGSNDYGRVFMHPGMTFSIPVSYSYPGKSSEGGQQAPGSFRVSQSGQLTTPVIYSLPQQATFSVGTSNIMTISSSSSPFVVGSQNNLSQIFRTKGPDVDSRSEPSRDVSVDGSPGDAELDDERLMIDMDSDQMDDDFGNDNDGSPDKNGGKKRRYPTSRPFKCGQCDHAFNQRIHLKKHMSKHTGVKPFKCQQCDYSTVERSHLKVHIRIHTGEKPFKCTFCEYATAQNSTLKIHLKRHHGGKMFECQTCKKKFTQKNLLQNHQEDHLRSPGVSEPIRRLLLGKGSVPVMTSANEMTESISSQILSPSETGGNSLLDQVSQDSTNLS